MEGVGRGIHTVDVCSSCMDLAWERVIDGRLPAWDSVVAERQTRGRGQFGRCWYSPPGNLYGALRLPRLGSHGERLLPLLLAEALHATVVRMELLPRIKWPNDLLVGGKKVGGILVEIRNDVTVVGIGLNLVAAPSAAGQRHPLAPEAQHLLACGVVADPLTTWQTFVHNVSRLVEKTGRQVDRQHFIDRLAGHLAYIGERILWESPGGDLRPAILTGLDMDGGIRVLTPEGEQRVHSGSIYPVISETVKGV